MKINKKIFDNGLRLVHNEDTSTQMVALNIVYDVGARDEHPEHTGFAHLFEHLMFGGSVHIPDYDAPLQLAGGENNAWTNNDITNYYLTVPKSNVEIGFWLESDRMLELAFSEQSLEVQRAVVMEEFKQRCLNQPYGDVGHLLRPLAYQTHPYRWPTIGKDLSHIANATLDEVKEFFFRFYAPNNAVLAVTGNISWEETVRLTEKWFAPIPRRNVPVRQLPQEVVQTAERRQTVERNVPLDALFMAYHMCSREDADYYAFDILSDILSNGRSSRLTRRLVQEQKLVPVTDPDFELLAVNKAEGFRAGAEFYCLPPLELERYTGFTQPIQPRPIRQVSIELEVNTRHGDEDRAADAAGKAALRQQVARELYAQRCAQAKALARRELIFQLGGCVKGTLPKDLVSGNYFAEQRNFNLRLQANNVNFDQYLKVRGQTVEQFRTELHAQAEQKLRGSLGLLMVAERERLWPTDAEVDAALAHWKGERTFPANDFRKVRQGIASQRAAEFVEAHSTLLPPPEEPVLETIA